MQAMLFAQQMAAQQQLQGLRGQIGRGGGEGRLVSRPRPSWHLSLSSPNPSCGSGIRRLGSKSHRCNSSTGRPHRCPQAASPVGREESRDGGFVRSSACPHRVFDARRRVDSTRPLPLRSPTASPLWQSPTTATCTASSTSIGAARIRASSRSSAPRSTLRTKAATSVRVGEAEPTTPAAIPVAARSSTTTPSSWRRTTSATRT